MNCQVFMERLDDYIDDALEAAERAQLLKHAEGCPACAKELERAEALKRLLEGFDDQVAVPLAAQAAWRGAVKKEAKKKQTRRLMRGVSAVAAAFVMLVGTTLAFREAGVLGRKQTDARSALKMESPAVYYSGQRAANEALALGGAALETDGDISEPEMAEESAMAYDALPIEASEAAGETAEKSALMASEPLDGEALEEAVPEADTMLLAEADTSMDSGVAPAEETLLARSAFREIYTENFDEAHARVADLAEEYGGYLMEDALTNAEGTRSVELLAAVPVEDLDGFLAALDYLGVVTQAEVKSEDITLNYYDAQGRLDALELEKDRLETLISTAEDADALASLNAQLEEVFARIDALESESRGYENALELARVRVILREGEPGAVGALPDEGLGERMSGGFRGTLQSLKHFFSDMAVSLAVLAPVAAIVLPVVILAWILAVVLIRRHRRAREQQ